MKGNNKFIGDQFCEGILLSGLHLHVYLDIWLSLSPGHLLYRLDLKVVKEHQEFTCIWHVTQSLILC